MADEMISTIEKLVSQNRDLISALDKANSDNQLLRLRLEEAEKKFKQTEESAQKISASLDSASPAVASLSTSPSPQQHGMTPEEKYRLIRSIGEECIKEEELRDLLAKKPNPICYDGFEPSGRMHIAQGIMKTINVNKMTSAGCKVKILIADRFAKMNNKMGGDLEKIRKVGEYFIEIWKASGMDLQNVQFIWSSAEIDKRSVEYWKLVDDIAGRNTVNRIKKCMQITGRSEGQFEELPFAQALYPVMQCADVFFLEADICQMGMDQRKAQVNEKIRKAHCPPKKVEGNPCIEYIKYMLFSGFGSFEVHRQEQNGGNKVYTTMEEIIDDYESGDLHPGDLKPSLSKAINKILQPIRDHFENDSAAKELLETVKGYKVTR
ncbi:hypothetical protein LUZ60_005468 [Juncus effusus]|nr:hypothetical protein LUZ60_005468 [Juncus effusus]